MAAGTHPGRDPYGGCLTLARRARDMRAC